MQRQKLPGKKKIRTAADALKETYNLTSEELLEDENLVPRTITTIFGLVYKQIEEIKLIKETNLYKAVKEEENHLVDDKGYSRWEARLKALENRKYLIKDEIEDVLLEKSDDEQEEEEM